MADKFIKAENPGTASVPNIQMGSTLGGVTKLQSTNSATNRTLTLPDKDGIIATLADAQGNNSALLSAGCIAIPTFTDNGNGSATIGVGSYNIFNNTAGAGGLAAYTNVAGGTFTFVDGVNNYVVANYNNGSPILQSITNVALINETTIVPIYTVFRIGTDLDWLNWDTLGYALPNKIHQRLVKTQRFARQDGLGLSEIATRIVAISAGTVWAGATPIALSAFNSGTDVMIQAYHSAGVWTYLTTTTYNNTQYDNGTNLVTLSNNMYAVNFIYYIVQDAANKVVFVLGNSDASLAVATTMQPPASLPPEIASAGILVGRIIIQKSAATATQIDSAFNQFWGSGSGGGGGVSDHNALNGLQGGVASEYYHLTSAKYALANAMDQSVATTASPTFSTLLVANSGSGKTTLTRAASASNYVVTLPASTGTLVVDTTLAAYALKAGDTIGSVVLGDGTQQASFSVSATNGFVVRAKTGSANDWQLLGANGTTVLMSVPTGQNAISTGAVVSFTNTTASTSTSTGCALFYGGIGVAGDAWVGGVVNANNVKVSGGGVGQTTITRTSGSSSYTATLPDKSGTIAMLSDIPGGSTNVLSLFPHISPSSPSSIDDEFDSTTLDAKWTKVNFDSAYTTSDINTTAKSKLWVKVATGGGDNARSLMQPCPSGDFTIWTSLNFRTLEGNFSYCGILLANGATVGAGQQTMIGAGYYSRYIYWVHPVNNYNAGGNPIFTSALMSMDMFIRVRRVGSNYYAAWSSDGETWMEKQFTPFNSTTTYFGIFSGNVNNGLDVITSFDFFRYVNNGNATGPIGKYVNLPYSPA